MIVLPPEAPLVRRVLVIAAAVLGAWMTSSCKDAARAAGTSVYVRVNFTSDLVLTQIRFSAKSDHPLFDPVLRPPDDSGGALPSGQTLRILMPDSLGGQTVTVAAEGLYQGRVVNQDQSDVRVKKDYEVEIALTLPSASPQPSCGPCVGCCSGVTCVTSYSPVNCGNDLICTACNPTVADNCSTGDCRCGERPACSASLGSDRCVLGQCHCGTGDPCQPGQFCNNGQCQCTETSCPNGCCANNLCVPRSAGGDSVCGTASKACQACAPGQTCTGGACSDCPANCPSGCCSGGTCYPPGQANCGIGGSACVFCDPIASDSCNAQGFCACGAGLSCAPGQHCQNGACTCDAASCPNGCCRNNFCETPASPDGGTASSQGLCGKAGRACTACDPVRADSCTSSGVCACGAGPQCDLGQKCANGTCVCDPANCAGCCSSDGISCRAGNLDTECGRGGFNCQACPTGQSCTDGRCSNCNPSTCGGCCLGSSCPQPTPGPCPTDGSPCICGTGAMSCHSCATTVTDTCNADGTCGCGANGACVPGQRCIGGRCFCDAVSCPTGCCANGQCTQPSAAQCGTGGSSCFACSPVLANNCGSDGSCRCGSGPACVSGQQRCLSGGCVCDAVSCSSGCCNTSGQCLTPGLNNCGAMGSSCVSCDPIRADRCRNGTCSCGIGGICAEGQHCVSGVCHCDATSCASGCCSNNFCINPTTSANCGIGGARCVSCGRGSDRCTNGACQCGGGSPCTFPFPTCTSTGCQ